MGGDIRGGAATGRQLSGTGPNTGQRCACVCVCVVCVGKGVFVLGWIF